MLLLCGHERGQGLQRRCPHPHTRLTCGLITSHHALRVQIIPTCIFNKKDPIVLGVEVVEGIAKVSTWAAPPWPCEGGRAFDARSCSSVPVPNPSHLASVRLATRAAPTV